jgi:hypothetical protein
VEETPPPSDQARARSHRSRGIGQLLRCLERLPAQLLQECPRRKRQGPDRQVLEPRLVGDKAEASCSYKDEDKAW